MSGPARCRRTGPALLLAVLVAAGCTTTPPATNSTAASAPAGSWTTTRRGNQTMVITVDTADPTQLRAIFDTVRGEATEGDGWHVEVNCSTGATASEDNRLANGAFALTQQGLAQTGLKKTSESRFEMQPDAQCPRTISTAVAPAR